MDIFVFISIASIVSGGMTMAFGAKRPDRLTAWVSAYLVLVSGISQLGLLSGWQHLGQLNGTLVTAALIVYNCGNIGVLLGTIYKSWLKNYSWVVNLGGLLIALSMVLMLIVVSHAPASWTLAGFTVLVIIILVSMPIGLMMSARHRPERLRGFKTN